jgi:hypothetical protein
MPLFGRSISISISVVEGRRVNGKPKQFHLGYLGYVSVPCTSAEAEVGESFWRDVRGRMDEFNVPPAKQEEFVSQIESLLAAIVEAKGDSEKRKKLEENPNKLLTELRRGGTLAEAK